MSAQEKEVIRFSEADIQQIEREMESIKHRTALLECAVSKLDRDLTSRMDSGFSSINHTLRNISIQVGTQEMRHEATNAQLVALRAKQVLSLIHI
mgnify:CR=1 FL=1